MVKGDNEPLTPNNANGEYASGEAIKQQKKSKKVHFLVGLFLLVNIIVLYVLHFADRGSSDSSTAVAGSFTASGLSATSATTAQTGKAVSFGSDGALRVGAGTSAYLDVANLDAIDKAIAAIRFAPLGASKALYDTNIVSYQTGVSPNLVSVVTTFTGDVSAKTIKFAAAEDKNTFKGASIKGLSTLSDKSLAVLYSVSSADGMSITAYVAPATIADGKVAVTQANAVMAANNSATNFITRVSDSTFAVVYYEPYSSTAAYYQRVEVGSVVDGKITFSTSLQFGAANGVLSTTFGQPQGVFNSSDRFTVPWFVDNMAATKDNSTFAGAVGLCMSTFSYASGSVTSLGDSCQTQYLPMYYVESAKLSNNIIALAFIDRANKFALTVVIVEYSDITGLPTFRGSFAFDDATGAYDFGAAFGFYPKPSIRVLSNNRIAVGFLNPSNHGKPSVKVIKYASDLSMTEVSPALPISNADFSIASADPKAFGSLVLDMVPLTTGFVVGYAGSYAGTQQQRVAFVEAYGKPVGVISGVSGSEFDVAMSGTVDASELTAGRSYYAATNGQIYAPSTNTDSEYVLANGNKIVLSKDALVGVAVSGSKLFVAAQAN